MDTSSDSSLVALNELFQQVMFGGGLRRFPYNRGVHQDQGRGLVIAIVMGPVQVRVRVVFLEI